MTNFIVNAVQLLILLLAAPLLRGVIGKLKAIIQKRQGASVWRPYADLWKLLHKEELTPKTATFVFQAAPMIGFAVTVVAAAFLPLLHPGALLGLDGDIFLFVYLLAMSRFVISLGALDGGSAFGGMGSSREALIAALAEAPLLLVLTALAILAKTGSLSEIARWTIAQNFFDVSTVHILAFAAMAIVAVAETGRIPVDNPTTHLELTMIHEAMVLEYSGPSLALIEWSQAIKLHLMAALMIGLFSPWGMATGGSLLGLAAAFGFFALKVLCLALALSVIESSVAKLRMYAVPDFLRVASALGILAVIFTAITRR
ncbi:MAG TPA: NADH-quinone oxidoreductase subunit H [Candidatus Angelobacter sp.]|nr:NADH-quinone oxidoreductase subunit H [Candidatus Angelobacter sp.]